ncbi:S26 family signal peptidase [Actinomadura sp. 7K534]|nr:S26 family signal peptidase [Actinomadura sp. 7K534]TDB95848.1 S26 family signal peptidase [Actinomadura sp. 7K534]
MPVKGILVGVLAIAGSAVFVRSRLLIAEVSGPSMAPTLVPGDRVLTYRTAGRPVFAPGQVVVLRDPDRAASRRPGLWLIKRVVAVGGQAAPAGLPADVVPVGHLVVLGDNGRLSRDSRCFGFVPMTDVVGRAIRKMGS